MKRCHAIALTIFSATGVVHVPHAHAQTLDLGPVIGAFARQFAKDMVEGARMIEQGAPILRKMVEDVARTGKLPPELLPDPREKQRQKELFDVSLALARFLSDRGGPAGLPCKVYGILDTFEKDQPKALEYGPYASSVVEIVSHARGVASTRGIEPNEVTWEALKLLCSQLPEKVSPIQAMMKLPVAGAQPRPSQPAQR